tara:strand:- start:158 stop:727 length:570 start_codon:yes stop_codon:yes gene_type:complete
MKSPYSFIVKPVGGRRYSNVKDFGGVDFIISSSKEDHKVSNRLAEVIEVPLTYDGPIIQGDIILVHHNVFKFYNDIHGVERSGKSYFIDDLFFIDEGQYYMYKRDGKWNACNNFCFVKPIKYQQGYLLENKSEQELTGEVVHSNDRLRSVGINDGDIVGFRPDTEYEFEVDGEKLYRMFDKHITIKING